MCILAERVSRYVLLGNTSFRAYESQNSSASVIQLSLDMPLRPVPWSHSGLPLPNPGAAPDDGRPSDRRRMQRFAEDDVTTLRRSVTSTSRSSGVDGRAVHRLTPRGGACQRAETGERRWMAYTVHDEDGGA